MPFEQNIFKISQLKRRKLLFYGLLLDMHLGKFLEVLSHSRLKIKFAGVPFFSRALIMWIRTFLKFRKFLRAIKQISSPLALIELHFKYWSEDNHPSRRNLENVLSTLPIGGNILETGTAAWGTQSTRLFDAFIRSFGGKFFSVDIRSEPRDFLKFQLSRSSLLHVSDSVVFLNSLQASDKESIDLAYLDSKDVDLNSPWECAEHARLELEALTPLLRDGAIVLIDDTPKKNSIGNEDMSPAAAKFYDLTQELPGKGSLILSDLKKGTLKNFRIKFHNSQLALIYSKKL